MKLEFPNLVSFIEKFSEEVRIKYQPYCNNKYVRVETIIEDASSGTQIIQFLHSRGVRVEGIKPETDKETRLTGITHLLENVTVLLPNQQTGEMLDFFANIVAADKNMSIASPGKLKLHFNNTTYSVCDDSVGE